MYDRGLSKRNANQRLVKSAAGIVEWLIELKPDSMVAHGALEHFPAYRCVCKPRNFAVAVRTRINVAESATWTDRLKLRRNEAAIDTFGASSFLNNVDSHAITVSELLQNSKDFGQMIGGKLEVRVLLRVSTRSVPGTVRIDFDWRVSPKITAYIGGATKVIGRINRIMGNSDADALHEIAPFGPFAVIIYIGIHSLQRHPPMRSPPDFFIVFAGDACDDTWNRPQDALRHTMTMESLSFLSQPLLWGMSLAAIPIIIHLLFRRRFRRVDWAPMHYLKLSIQRNRRRVRIEQLLLLLLRTLLILLLFFFVARPVIHAAGLGKWLGGRSRASQILLLDDSLSMAYRDGGRSAFDRAKELAVTLLDSIGPKDRFTLVLASDPKQPLLREVELTNRDETAQILSRLQPTDTFISWEGVVQALDELIQTGSYPIRDVTLITDLRRAGWDETISPVGNRWSSQQIEMRIFDAGSDRTANVALEDLKQLDRLAMVGGPTQFEAVVHNASQRELNGADANWTIDGKPTIVRLPTIAAGETARVSLVATFQEAGRHHVEFSLPEDDLPGDNRRTAVCQVRDRVNILLVDGEPSSEPLAGEVDFLALALAISAADTDAFHVQVVTDSEWATLASDQSDLIVLANVGSMTPEQIARLERQVAAGAGLMVFPGDQIDASDYTQLLYCDGEGLLPAAPETTVDEEFSGLVLEGGAPGPLDALSQLSPAVLERVKVRRFWQVRLAEKEHPNVRVLARWNNAESSPAVVEKQFGHGQVLLWTTTADKQWTDWPTEPSYVLGMREACAATVRSDEGTRSLTAGDTLRLLLPEGEQLGATLPTVETPGAEKPHPLRVLEDSVGNGLRAVPQPTGGSSIPAPRNATEGVPYRDLDSQGPTLTYADTRRAGLYKLSWNIVGSGDRTDMFAVVPDRRESRLNRITAEELRGLWGTFQPQVISLVSAADAPLAVRGQEIWRTLAMGMLGLLVVESCFATWTGRQR